MTAIAAVKSLNIDTLPNKGAGKPESWSVVASIKNVMWYVLPQRVKHAKIL